MPGPPPLGCERMLHLGPGVPFQLVTAGGPSEVVRRTRCNARARISANRIVIRSAPQPQQVVSHGESTEAKVGNIRATEGYLPVRRSHSR